MDLAARLAAISLTATVRLSYVPLSRRPDGLLHHLDVTWRGVDHAANVVRFDSGIGGRGIRSYAAPISDVEEAWCPAETWHVRLSGYLDHVLLEPYRYVSARALVNTQAPLVLQGGGIVVKAGDGGQSKGGDVVIVGDIRGGDAREQGGHPESASSATRAMDAVLAAKKSDAIDRLSKVADQLTRLILAFDPRYQGIRLTFPVVALPDQLFAYPRLVHETQIYFSAEFLAELRAFGACAQTAYSELTALPRGDNSAHITAVHARVETARAHLIEASRRALHR